ncbi:MAG TPA: ferritin-like domain-containing protein [Gemmatimonadaceae bacterium]|nr:ferritin-like domain-containing protein [Gemmatimonadaceae bacterium]
MTRATPFPTAQVSDRELGFLNFYRASELHGGLILAQVARRTRDGRLAGELLHHAAEEIEHARLWTETILAVGGRVSPVRETYQDRYAAAIGRPVGVLHVLALTQVFERRVYRHFAEHLRRPGTHPAVCVTLQRMLEEEKGHLRWVKAWLDHRAAGDAARIRTVMRRYAEVDARIYAALSTELGWREAA